MFKNRQKINKNLTKRRHIMGVASLKLKGGGQLFKIDIQRCF